jgi:hypothetical protein
MIDNDSAAAAADDDFAIFALLPTTCSLVHGVCVM